MIESISLLLSVAVRSFEGVDKCQPAVRIERGLSWASLLRQPAQLVSGLQFLLSEGELFDGLPQFQS